MTIPKVVPVGKPAWKSMPPATTMVVGSPAREPLAVTAAACLGAHGAPSGGDHGPRAVRAVEKPLDELTDAGTGPRFHTLPACGAGVTGSDKGTRGVRARTRQEGGNG